MYSKKFAGYTKSSVSHSEKKFYCIIFHKITHEYYLMTKGVCFGFYCAGGYGSWELQNINPFVKDL